MAYCLDYKALPSLLSKRDNSLHCIRGVFAILKTPFKDTQFGAKIFDKIASKTRFPPAIVLDFLCVLSSLCELTVQHLPMLRDLCLLLILYFSIYQVLICFHEDGQYREMCYLLCDQQCS